MEFFESIARNWEAIIAITAVILSTLSLIIQRKHNRLSVRPLMDIGVTILNGNFNITLENSGLGPAVFTSFVISSSSRKVYLDIQEFIDIQIIPLTSNLDSRKYFPKGSFISPDEKIEFIKHNIDEHQADQLADLFDGLTFRIEYTDIYKRRHIQERHIQTK